MTRCKFILGFMPKCETLALDSDSVPIAPAAMKSPKWRYTLPPGAPQDGWKWFDVDDAGSFKSEFNGPHDLSGGVQCGLCGTWHRYVHHLTHKDMPGVLLKVGSDCASYLTGGLNCYRIEEEFIRSQRRWERDEAARRRREADEAARRRYEADAAERRQREAEERRRQAAEATARLQREEAARRQREAAEAAARQRRLDHPEAAVSECLSRLKDLEATWCDLWLPCKTNSRHYKKKIKLELFEADATLFLSKRRPGHYRFVLNVPDDAIWARRDYPHPAQAARAVYQALHDYVETLHLTHPDTLRRRLEETI